MKGGREGRKGTKKTWGMACDTLCFSLECLSAFLPGKVPPLSPSPSVRSIEEAALSAAARSLPLGFSLSWTSVWSVGVSVLSSATRSRAPGGYLPCRTQLCIPGTSPFAGTEEVLCSQVLKEGREEMREKKEVKWLQIGKAC